MADPDVAANGFSSGKKDERDEAAPSEKDEEVVPSTGIVHSMWRAISGESHLDGDDSLPAGDDSLPAGAQPSKKHRKRTKKQSKAESSSAPPPRVDAPRRPPSPSPSLASRVAERLRVTFSSITEVFEFDAQGGRRRRRRRKQDGDGAVADGADSDEAA